LIELHSHHKEREMTNNKEEDWVVEAEKAIFKGNIVVILIFTLCMATIFIILYITNHIYANFIDVEVKAEV
jgi:hypothetical protein